MHTNHMHRYPIKTYYYISNNNIDHVHCTHTPTCTNRYKNPLILHQDRCFLIGRYTQRKISSKINLSLLLRLWGVVMILPALLPSVNTTPQPFDLPAVVSSVEVCRFLFPPLPFKLTIFFLIYRW